MARSERSFSTSGKGEFIVDQAPIAKKLRAQKGCICIDRLVDEERERHAKNIAFQKALIKRLEASERRITYDEDDDEPKVKISRGVARKEELKEVAAQTTPPPQLKLPSVKPIYKEEKCLCYKKIRKEECKRKRFVSRLQKEQEKYERQNIKAQKKYEKQRIKAFKKCEKMQKKIESQYNNNDKTVQIKQGEELYSVYLHMDPGECGCNPREVCMARFKRRLYKCCTLFYIFGIVIFIGVYYVYNKF